MLLLALFLLVQNLYILGKKRWKKNKILPILQQESAGPFATTAMGPGGFVIPKVPNWVFTRLDIIGQTGLQSTKLDGVGPVDNIPSTD